MKSNIRVILLLLSVSVSLFAADSGALKLKATIPLPGVKGRFDHFAIDMKSHRLFVAALGNNSLEIIDTVESKKLQSITGLHKPTGVAYLPEVNHIAVANGDDGTLKLFDGSTYALVKTLGSLDDADNVRFDAKANRLYVGYGNGALAILDVASWKQIGRIKLPAHPESFQLEQQGSRIFVNVTDAKQIAVIDREKQSVLATWPMDRFQAHFPMALDESNHRLFVGCRKPARLVVFDTTTGKLVSDLAISGDTDDLFYDAKLKRLYLSCGEGFVDVIEQRSTDTYQLRERIPTRAGARTAFFSAALDEFYLAVPQRGDQQAEVRIFAVNQ
jgi:DNA-binding beta-propeller fold protein YncE